MEQAKYIKFSDGSVAVFPAYIEHVDVANSLSKEASTAGFVRKVGSYFRAVGHSTSLQIQSSEDDDQNLTLLLSSTKRPLVCLPGDQTLPKFLLTNALTSHGYVDQKGNVDFPCDQTASKIKCLLGMMFS